MKKALLIAPMASTIIQFCEININLLIAWGFEVHIAANFSEGTEGQKNKNEEFIKNARAKEIVVHNIPFSRASLIKNISQIKKVRQLLSEHNFDLIHAHTETGGIILRLSVSSRTSAKLLYTPHGMSFYKGSSIKSQIIYRPIEWWICRSCDAVIAINQEEYSVLSAWNKNTAKYTHGIGIKIANAALPIKSEKRQELGIPADATLMVSVGELNDNKNHVVCIKALEKSSDYSLYYLICGAGPLKDKLLRMIWRANVADRIILPGYRSDISDILSCADIFLFPSVHEGLSVALMEAMEAGLPVVCSDIRGNVDLIENGKGGYLCNADDAAAFAAAIEKLSQNPEERKRMGEVNRKNVRNYSEPSVYDELIKIYGEVLGCEKLLSCNQHYRSCL